MGRAPGDVALSSPPLRSYLSRVTTLHFTLKVPGQDSVTLTGAVSIQYRFRGCMRVEDDYLRIEWTGTGKREAAGLLGVEVSETPLPVESLDLPLREVRLFRLHAGWFRTRVTLAAHGLDALRIIPSEENGVVHFWIPRADRPLAAQLIAAVLGKTNA